MASKLRKRKQKKPRNLVVLGMILTRKGGYMKDRREKRKGAHNEQQELLAQAQDEG